MEKIVLGIDLGTNSVGWGLIKVDEYDIPTGLIDSGVRIFEAGLDGDIPSGNAESRCAQRRLKRMARRMLARRRRRMMKVKNILQKNSLLPAGDDMGKITAGIDSEVLEKLSGSNAPGLPSPAVLPHVLPYYLRSIALDEKLDKYALGRVLYQLAQRRGFLSSRRTLEDKDSGVIKKEISELESRIAESGARTLGEYFSRLDPKEKRIRTLHTSRQMFIDEFNKICDAQQELISPELHAALYDALFFQRKLKSAKGLVGGCTLEKGVRRCAWYRPEAQKFRYLQTINNLNVILPDGAVRGLNGKEWDILSNALDGCSGALDRHGNLKITEARKMLALPKGARFSIEEGGEKSLKGNEINACMMPVFGNRWIEMSEYDKEELLQDLHSFENDEALIRRIIKRWGLDSEKAAELAAVRLPEDYCMVSRKAIMKLLPDMEQGTAFQTAVKKHYPDFFTAGKIHDRLLSLDDSELELRNPAVSRAISQVRKVVNSIIGKYGKPDKIRIELARDMKNSSKEKKKIIEHNRDNEAARKRAQTLLFEQLGIEKPKSDDILKILLAEECGWKCPYTHRPISMNALFGDNPQFEIEHIIPYSRCLDNSFANKTLCWHEENRAKRNRTPFEAYFGDEARYNTMLMAVSKFQGRLAARKKELFELTDTEELENFSSRQLNDTRYATKAVMQYLAMLYGGTVDDNGQRRIQSMTGGITALVRKAWGMNRILGDGEKNRDDHRHHAVDAVAIAMTGPALVKRLTDFIKNREKQQIFNMRIEEPLPVGNWTGFLDDLRNAIGKITVSHSPSRKISGALHEETIYSRDFQTLESNGKTSMVKHIRKSLTDIAAADVEKIVDQTIQKLVADKLAELGIKDPKKAFASAENLPVLRRQNGSAENRIKCVKIERAQSTTRIGEGDRAREVVTGNNHHMEIVAILDEKGNEVKWEGYVVSMLEAKQRLKMKEPVVKKDFGANTKFKFSICCNDIIEVDIEDKKEICVVRTIPLSKQIAFVKHTEARKKTDVQNDKVKAWFTALPDPMRKKNCRKLTITPLGEVRRAND